MAEGPQRSPVPRDARGGRRATDDGEELRRFEELFATAQRLARIGSWEWDIPADCVVWSDELHRIYGRDPAAGPLTYATFLELTHPDDRSQVAAIVGNAFQTPQGFEVRYRIVRPDGAERRIVGAGEVLVDAEGRARRMVGTAQDVTDQVAGEAAVHLTTILDGIGEIFIATDAAWRITFLNERAERYLVVAGTRRDPRGAVLWEVLPGLAGTSLHAAARRAETERRPAEAEEYAPQLERWFNARITPVRDGFVIYTRDVTERKRAEAEARASHGLLQALVEATADSIFVKDLEGRYVLVNPACARGMGRPAEEILGSSDFELFPPDVARRYRANDQRILARGETRTFEEPGPRGGASPRVLSATKGVLRDAEGRVSGIVGIAHDITKRKRAEDALRVSEERFRTLVQSIDDVIFELDREGRVVAIFGRWLERQGLAPAQFVGLAVRDILGAAAMPAHEGPFRRALAGASVVYESSLTTLAGTRAMQISLSPLRNGRREITGVVGVAREITERQRAEQRQRFVAEASALLSASLDYEATLTSVAQLAVGRLCDLCVIDLLEDEDGGSAVRRVAVAHRDPALQATAERLRRYAPPPGAKSAAWHVIESGRTLVNAELPDLRVAAMAHDDEHLGLLRLLAVRSSIVVPLVARGRTLGSMSLVATVAPRQYEPEDIALAEELGVRTALAVDNARLYRDAQREIAARERQERAQRFLAQASRVLGSSIEFEQTLASVARLVVPELADFCLVDLIDERGTVQRVEVAHRDPATEARLRTVASRIRPDPAWEHHPGSRTLRTGEPTLLAEVDAATAATFAQDEAHRAYLRELAPISVLTVPLAAHGRTLGVITLCYAESGRHYGEAELALALDLADRAALAVDHARLYRAAQAELRQRVEAEAELGRWANIFEHAGWGVLIVSAANELIEAANPAVAQMHGYAVTELVGRTLSSVLAPEGRAALPERIRQAREQGRLAFETRHQRADGTVFPVSVDLTVVQDERSPLEYYAINVQDLTAQRRAEEQVRQAQKMEALGRLAGGVAHDFNNMLMIIIGFTDFLLASTEREDPRWEDADEIRKAAERASALTRQLLAFGHRTPIEAQVVDLNAVVRDMERMLRPLLGEGIRLVTSYSSSLGGVEADRGQVEQVVMNLALNARDAMSAGGQLTIETMNVSFPEGYAYRTVGIDIPAGDYVMLLVGDTGHGMDAETRTRIFEPFFSTKPTARNSGLGLATVYGIVTQGGGYIWVDSEPGVGTTFKLCFPRVGAVAGAAATAGRALPRGGDETVLVVEDEAAVRTLACRVLADQGYRVLAAANGREGLEVLAREGERIALVLTDVVMPELGGQELAAEVSRRHPDVPVLYMSGYTDNEVLRRGLDRSGAVFLQKPFSPDSLAHKVREVLDERVANS